MGTSTDLARRYREFRTLYSAHAPGGTYIAAHLAMYYARAEQRAEREGLRVFYEPEQENYRDVYGEDPPEGAEFSLAAVYSAHDADRIERTGSTRGCMPLASLGFVETGLATFADMRAQEADLLGEALAELDAERARNWAASG